MNIQHLFKKNRISTPTVSIMSSPKMGVFLKWWCPSFSSCDMVPVVAGSFIKRLQPAYKYLTHYFTSDDVMVVDFIEVDIILISIVNYYLKETSYNKDIYLPRWYYCDYERVYIGLYKKNLVV